MEMKTKSASIELKAAAFKALLQGPAAFAQFSRRFNVSHCDMQEWLDDAGANLGLAMEMETKIQSGLAGVAPKKCGSPLVSEEREILFGKQEL